MIEIEDGIPYEPRSNTLERYPWQQLEIGQSFLYPGKVKSATMAAVRAGKRWGKTFRVRAMEDGVRIWRVA